MTDRDYIITTLPSEEICAQLAEECAELSKAALKVRRCMDSSPNPTPVSLIKATENLVEELADVYCCLDLVIGALDLSPFEIISISNFKKTRWADRIKKAKEDTE